MVVFLLFSSRFSIEVLFDELDGAGGPHGPTVDFFMSTKSTISCGIFRKVVLYVVTEMRAC